MSIFEANNCIKRKLSNWNLINDFVRYGQDQFQYFGSRVGNMTS